MDKFETITLVVSELLDQLKEEKEAHSITKKEKIELLLEIGDLKRRVEDAEWILFEIRKLV